MTVWRMSFRVGNQGTSMWEKCREYKVAAITYEPVLRINLSNYQEYEPIERWNRLKPTQKRSLHRVVYEMKSGDVIYVKEGKRIISKGIIIGKYKFDSKYRIIDENNNPWAHQVPVRWQVDFPEIEVLLGAEQLTVKELPLSEVKKIESKVKKTKIRYKQIEALEGKLFVAEVNFRNRNRELIHIKKIRSDYSCEACGFKFEKMYGKLGKRYIIAHHRNPITKGPRVNTLNDIALLCANCHAMVHAENPPMSIRKLKKVVSKNS